jgi:hypothetical protein
MKIQTIGLCSLNQKMLHKRKVDSFHPYYAKINKKYLGFIRQIYVEKKSLTMCSIYSVILLPLKFWIYYNYIVDTFYTILLRNSLNISYFL